MSRPQILLLESDKHLANNLTQILKRRGYKVDWQVEPQAATDSADHHQPDIIILDLLLAGRSGIEFLYELRSYPDWQRLPVVIFSEVSPEELDLSAAGLADLKVVAYHHKPSTLLAELAQTVDQLLQPTKA